MPTDSRVQEILDELAAAAHHMGLAARKLVDLEPALITGELLESLIVRCGSVKVDIRKAAIDIKRDQEA